MAAAVVGTTAVVMGVTLAPFLKPEKSLVFSVMNATLASFFKPEKNLVFFSNGRPLWSHFLSRKET